MLSDIARRIEGCAVRDESLIARGAHVYEDARGANYRVGAAVNDEELVAADRPQPRGEDDHGLLARLALTAGSAGFVRQLGNKEHVLGARNDARRVRAVEDRPSNRAASEGVRMIREARVDVVEEQPVAARKPLRLRTGRNCAGQRGTCGGATEG